MKVAIDHQIVEGSKITQIEEDKIGAGRAKALPIELQKSMIELLNQLKQKGIKEIDIKESIPDSLLKVGRYWVAITDFLDQDIKKMFLETIELLVWYMSPHWSRPDDPKTLSSFFCTDCLKMSRSIQMTKHCEFPECPSHEKWRTVIGPSYIPPPQEKKAS